MTLPAAVGTRAGLLLAHTCVLRPSSRMRAIATRREFSSCNSASRSAADASLAQRASASAWLG